MYCSTIWEVKDQDDLDPSRIFYWSQLNLCGAGGAVGAPKAGNPGAVARGAMNGAGAAGAVAGPVGCIQLNGCAGAGAGMACGIPGSGI